MKTESRIINSVRNDTIERFTEALNRARQELEAVGCAKLRVIVEKDCDDDEVSVLLQGEREETAEEREKATNKARALRREQDRQNLRGLLSRYNAEELRKMAGGKL